MNNLEDLVLGGILHGDSRSIEAMDMLTDEDFTDYNNKSILNAIKRVFYDRALIIDCYTVFEELKRAGVDIEFSDLTEKQSLMYSGTKSVGYAKELKEKRREEKVIRKLSTATQAYSEAENKEEYVNELIASLSDNKNEKYTATDFAEGTAMLMEHLQMAENGQISPTIKTGIREIDSRINITNGNYVTIAARASQGKTSIALSMAKNMALEGKRVLFFSYEMDILPIMMKLNSYLTYTPIENLTNFNINEKEKKDIVRNSKRIENDNFTLITRSKPKASVMANIVRKENKKKKVDIVMVDYIGLMSPEKTTGSRAYDIENISRAIQQMAVEEFNIPFVVLTQLNRDIEGRAEKRIMLSDLRDSGAIEQNSDIVIAINRDHPELRDADNTDLTVVQILKNRMGKLGHAIVRFDPVTTEFLDD